METDNSAMTATNGQFLKYSLTDKIRHCVSIYVL